MPLCGKLYAKTAFFQFVYIVRCPILLMHFMSGFKKGLIKVCAIFQHGVYDDKKLSGKGNDGLFGAFLLLELPVLGRQVTVTLACALIVAGRESCLGANMFGGFKGIHIRPDFSDDGEGGSGADAEDGDELLYLGGVR